MKAMPVDIVNYIQDIIRNIGDDPKREGLLETPDRVIMSWDKLYGGYTKDVKEIFKTFDSNGYDEIVLLKDIEFYSTCEHHMLPFFGKAHIAYIPNNKVIGISKLARLLEIYSRRLQIQERIGIQVTQALDKYLTPIGSACIIEARHFCMIARGIEKQNSVMTTSVLTGAFKTKIEAREELMRLIK
jgi:GTP cyclohydrolase I